MTIILKPILSAAFIGLAFGGCSAASDHAEVVSKTDVQTVKAAQSATGYSKPSAAIDFQHDFSGRSTVGATQIVNMKVLDRYPGGSMTLNVIPSEGVTLFDKSSQRAFKMAGGENNFQLQFQTNSEGVHNITVVAIAKMADGQSITRSYSMPIYVGDQYQPVKKGIKNPGPGERVLQKNENSGGLVILEAEETIETSD